MPHALKTVPLKKMLQVIEQYGIKRDLLEKSGTNTDEILQLYQLVRKNMHIRKEIQMARYLKEYVEKRRN